MIDPIVVAVSGALVTVVGLFYRDLLRQRERCEAEVAFWRDRYFGVLVKAEIVVDEVAKSNA